MRTSFAVWASSALLGLTATTQAQVSFEPRSIADHTYGGGWEHFVGGGLSAFDCNGDGLPELLAAGGSNPTQLFINHSEQGGELSFEPASLQPPLQTGIIGAYPIDIDNDAILDLVVLRVGENQILQGLGDCAFQPFSDLAIESGDRWTTAFSATWEAGQTLPTLAFGNYVDRSNPEGPFETCDANELWRPSGENYTDPTILEPGYCALSILFSDWNRDGRADLRVSNDRHYYVRGGEEQLWAMEASPRLYGLEDGWNSHQLWGMGIASRDLDGDGLSEVYLTSMGDQRLQMLVEGSDQPSFVDAPFEAGSTAHRPYTGGDGRPSTGWHAVFGDVQNDGLADLFVAKGNVEQMPGSAMDDPNNLLIGVDGGLAFEEAGLSAGIASLHRGRGGVLIDLNADGLQDLAVVNRNAPLELYQNTTADTGNWIGVNLRQAPTNRFAIGSFVEVRLPSRTLVQEVTIGGGHAGGVVAPLHFGVGEAATAELRVTWPDGTQSDWQSVDINQVVSIQR